MSTADALAYARAHRTRFLAELKDFIRFPSVSGQLHHAGDRARCARWLASHLRRLGLNDVKLVSSPEAPVVYAEWRHTPGRPTVLIYGHYDVIPSDPVSEWRSPPFEPTVRGENLFGRGACDDKGQMWTHVKAIEAYLRAQRALPINVKCIFEGEEEIGSPSLVSLISRNKDALAADAVLMSDTLMLSPGQPAISYATRGDLYLELEVLGSKHDLHSGNFGGAIHNPLQALCEIIAKLHDSNGRIAVPGLYDRVRRWSGREQARMAEFGAPDALVLEDAGSQRGWGERGYSLYERLTVRPALTINGIAGGYRGPGRKGVIPARVVAKLGFRLVPDQDPREVDRLFREQIARITPSTVRTKVRTVSGTKPALVNPEHPMIRAAVLACRRGFGTPPALLRSGGTIPVVSAFQQVLRAPVVLMGFALPNDRLHAPNEKLHLPTFFNGIAASIWFLAILGGARKIDQREEETEMTLASG
jgi:acetylornithine deacetylase/succinyl-diaminopimelate desuccinylase-like protein